MPKNSAVLEKPEPSHCEKMTEAQLVAKLKSSGVDVRRDKLEKIFDHTLSIAQLTEFLIDKQIERKGTDSVHLDWIMVCLPELSRRWFSGKASFDRLDARMEASYDCSVESNAGLDTWLSAWQEVLTLQEVTHIRSAREFDDHFPGPNSLHGWFDDFDMTLAAAGLSDPDFHRLRIALCEEALERFPSRDSLVVDLWTDQRRTSLAGAHFEIGEKERTDQLYEQWLTVNPRWGSGWYSWASCFTFDEPPRLARAEQLLKKGLAVQGVTERTIIVENLIEMYGRQSRFEEAAELEDQVFNDCEGSFEESDDEKALKEFWNDSKLIALMSELLVHP